MNRRTLVMCSVTALALPTAALAAGQSALAAKTKTKSASPAVTIRIEGASKTLLHATQVHGSSGYLTKYGAPKGECSGQSAQGALDVATHGHWTGTWDAQYSEYFISSILGETPKGSYYWTIFVANKTASVGACDVKLHAGEQLLFAVTDGKQYPAALRTVSTATSGKAFQVKLVGYTASGKAKPLAGTTITGKGIKAAKTNNQGLATVSDSHAGSLVLRAAPKGYVRTEATVRITA